MKRVVAVHAHPSVHASAAIGQPDPSCGEVAMAFVELEEGAEFDEKALRAHCREFIGQNKVPREIRRLDELPRYPTGKIMRRALSAETGVFRSRQVTKPCPVCSRGARARAPLHVWRRRFSDMSDMALFHTVVVHARRRHWRQRQGTGRNGGDDGFLKTLLDWFEHRKKRSDA